MKILAIESASVTASCAVSNNDNIIGEFTLSHKKTHSEKLMPLIENMLNEIDVKISDIDLIAISEGPGSYTGLRIGASIAKSIAYALNIPIANIPTIKSLASNIFDTSNLIVPIMDARAGRIYTGIYKWEEGKLISIKEQFPSTINELINLLNTYTEPVIFNGDGSEIYSDYIAQNLRIKYTLAPKQFNILKASALALLGYEVAINKEVISASEFIPKYLRLSQAERNNI